MYEILNQIEEDYSQVNSVIQSKSNLRTTKTKV